MSLSGTAGPVGSFISYNSSSTIVSLKSGWGARLLGRRVVTDPRNSELEHQVKPGRLKEDLTTKTLANMIVTNRQHQLETNADP
jgi:hypothetical protein